MDTKSKRNAAVTRCLVSALLFLFASGCATKKPDRLIQRTDPWQWRGVNGQAIQTLHYRIHTDVADADAVSRLAARMEQAYLGYRQLISERTAGLARGPLELFVFARYEDFAAYTIDVSGAAADVNLSVGHGGYAIGDRFVCYFGNEPDVLAVAAHEGFHQYVARHTLPRLPPALEEGLAATFETTDRAVNPRRQLALGKAIANNALIPFDTLIMLHAGDVAGRSIDLNETFYAQCWALARMLETDPTYATDLKKMLADIAIGRVLRDVGKQDGSGIYKPAAIGPLFKEYITTDWRRFEADYLRTCRRLADAADYKFFYLSRSAENAWVSS